MSIIFYRSGFYGQELAEEFQKRLRHAEVGGRNDPTHLKKRLGKLTRHLRFMGREEYADLHHKVTPPKPTSIFTKLARQYDKLRVRLAVKHSFSATV